MSRPGSIDPDRDPGTDRNGGTISGKTKTPLSVTWSLVVFAVAGTMGFASIKADLRQVMAQKAWTLEDQKAWAHEVSSLNGTNIVMPNPAEIWRDNRDY